MKQRICRFTMAIIFIISMFPFAANAAYSPQTSFGAPKDFSVQLNANETAWNGFSTSVSASDELRAFVDQVGDSNSDFNKESYGCFTLYLQLDYKTDGGSWHYSSDWDSDFAYNSTKSICNISQGVYSATSQFDKNQLESISSGEAMPENKGYYDSHTVDLRSRFLVHYQDVDGKAFDYYSPWSSTVSYSNNQKAEDPAVLINHKPVLKSVELKMDDKGAPHLIVKADNPHADIRHLNSISGGGVTTEIWIKVGNGEWKMCHTNSFIEEFDVSVLSYMGLKENYDAAEYQVKFCYTYAKDLYPLVSHVSSPFSNIISHGMPAYSEASAWAKPELEKAGKYELIPDILKGADMTKPITREEFAELSVRLYEKTTGKAATPVSPNPFSDTNNPEILKAYKLGIINGISATTFCPKQLTNREQVAAMLSRAIRVMVPDGDFSTSGAPVFTDQKEISAWALEHVLFISKAGIITGSNGKFMPKGLTTTKSAQNYGTTTREQALAMSARIYEKYK